MMMQSIERTGTKQKRRTYLIPETADLLKQCSLLTFYFHHCATTMLVYTQLGVFCCVTSLLSLL